MTTDTRPVFSSLQDTAGNGLALDRILDNTSPAASKNGSLAFSFKTAAGNAILPTLLSDGSIKVSMNSSGNQKYQRAEYTPAAAGIASINTVVSMTLTTAKVYSDFNIQVTARRDSFFQLVQVDGATETKLLDFIVGPGQYTINAALKNTEITAGATGTQVVKLVGYNFENVSTLYGTITCLEEP